MIRKLLIANRGEIAIRIMRTAREMGIRTVAVYSEADRHCMHPRFANEAIQLEAEHSHEGYLDIAQLLDLAERTGADSIHPGYGFLSERAELSEACRERGVVFVGPSPEAMRRLGSKIDAKRLAVEVGVPITPGYFEPDASPEALAQAAREIGYPVMLKASAGGGGRGMRVVRDPDQFEAERRIASDEAAKGFGDGTMMIEKYIERPRHLEVQFLADAFGEVAALFERECSLQRRHQKLIEEAPSPTLSQFPELWPQMRQATLDLARAAGYVGAGTAEFMVDPETGEFYFLEVNARLQVEHPVTEAVTGLDLVREQIRIASGLRLELKDDLLAGERRALCGHSIEARIVAENPSLDFRPAGGPILGWATPVGPGIRVDAGYGPHTEVSRFYDSLLAKLIVHAPNREAARMRLRQAALDFHILGVETNLAWLIDVLDHPDFAAGTFDTGWIGRALADWKPSSAIPAGLGDVLGIPTSGSQGAADPAQPQLWSAADRFRNVPDGT